MALHFEYIERFQGFLDQFFSEHIAPNISGTTLKNGEVTTKKVSRDLVKTRVKNTLSNEMLQPYFDRENPGSFEDLGKKAIKSFYDETIIQFELDNIPGERERFDRWYENLVEGFNVYVQSEGREAHIETEKRR
jgi:hypothetical protein